MNRRLKIALLAGLFVVSIHPGLRAQSAPTVVNTEISLVIFPMAVSDDIPQVLAPGTFVSDISRNINSAIASLSSPSFNARTIAAAPEHFRPGLPPDVEWTDGATYSLASELYYDSQKMETQCRVWLYDNTVQELVATDMVVFSQTAGADSYDDAREATRSLITYVLILIPTYTVTISGGTGGIVRQANRSKTIGAGQSAVYKVYGSYYALSFRAVPTGSLVFKGWRINNGEVFLSANPLVLEINPKTRTVSNISQDPLRTKRSLAIKAEFEPPE